MYALVVRFDLPDADAAAAFDDLVAEVVPTMVESEPGTLVYTTHTVIDAPWSRIFYEVYRDRDALDEHEARPATAAFLARVRALEPVVRVEAVTPDRS
ncbi:putative quinol monooxygenase [Jatrophihabitans sp. YIM 134969]